MAVELDNLCLRSLLVTISLFFLSSVIGSCSRGSRWSGGGPGCGGEGPGATHSLCGPSGPLADGGGHGQGDSQPNAHCHPSSRIPARHVEKGY